MSETTEAEEVPETVRVQATIPVYGLQRGQVGRIARSLAIDAAQSGWVKILDDEEEPDGVQGVRPEGGGNAGQPDLDWAPRPLGQASDPDDSTV